MVCDVWKSIFADMNQAPNIPVQLARYNNIGLGQDSEGKNIA